MKKFAITALATLVLTSFASVFAQVTHDVDITIPEVAFLRFTATDAITDVTAVTTGLDIEFALLAADVSGAAPIAPSNAPAWGDLKVFVNYDSNWDVTVTAVDTSAGDPFVWTKVGAGGWTIDGGVAGSGTATGWTSLGFGGDDFLLTLDGTEIAADYSATVTYTLTAP